MKKHVAIYGRVKILRGYCKDCQQYALILYGIIQCCDKPLDEIEEQEEFGYKRMAQGAINRKRPSLEAITKMLFSQDQKCIYCNIPFGTSYQHPKLRKFMETKVCCDHFVPFKYSQDNGDLNFVLACGTCNGIKSDKMFNTMEDARAYVESRRKNKGYTQEIYVL